MDEEEETEIKQREALKVTMSPLCQESWTGSIGRSAQGTRDHLALPQMPNCAGLGLLSPWQGGGETGLSSTPREVIGWTPGLAVVMPCPTFLLSPLLSKSTTVG